MKKSTHSSKIILKGCDYLTDKDCPYGASNCPKVDELKRMIEKNGKDLADLNRNVIAMKTTLKNASLLITSMISIFIAIIGVIRI